MTSADLGRARLPRTTPIPVVAKSLNSGITTRVKQLGAETHVTFSGKATGPTSRDVFGGMMRGAAEYHPVQLSVAIDEAPTTDALGRTNFSERNNRAMVTSPRGGETGADLADKFARQLNRDVAAFRATVKPGPTANSAVLVISRR